MCCHPLLRSTDCCSSAPTPFLTQGLPTVPEVNSLFVEEDTLETLIAEWYMPNQWTALTYRYILYNAAGDNDEYYDSLSWPGDSMFRRTVSPQAGGTYSGSGEKQRWLWGVPKEQQQGCATWAWQLLGLSPWQGWAR